jgi:hypothetical protein
MIVGFLTADILLREAWRRQIPESCVVVDLLDNVSLSFLKIPPSNRVLIWDLSCDGPPEVSNWKGLLICVGEPGSVPFEQAKIKKGNGVRISYGDSLKRIGDFLAVAIETNRLGHLAQSDPDLSAAVGGGVLSSSDYPMDGYKVLEFVDSALDVLSSKGALLFESKREIRTVARCSTVRFFFPRGELYISDCGEFSFSAKDPLLGYLSSSPVPLDGVRWPSDMHPAVEVAVRTKMAVWGAKLLVPIHKDGIIEGLVSLSVREDGGNYVQGEQRAVIRIVRVARRLLEMNRTLEDLGRFRDESLLFKAQLPATLVLGPNEEAPRSVPSAIKDLIGKTRREGGVHRLIPCRDQPLRGKVGLDATSLRVWACWEDCGTDFIQDDERIRGGLALWLRDLSMTLNHELGNALMPFAVLRNSKEPKEISSQLMEIVTRNIRYLEELNTKIANIGELVFEPRQVCDLRDLVGSLCNGRGINLEIGPDPVLMNCCRDLLSAAISAILDALHESRARDSGEGPCVRVGMAASLDRKLGLIAIRGRGMQLEGVLPEPRQGDVPSQGRLLMLLAREIIKLNQGEITVGPGLEGVEIRVSILSL